MGGGAAAGAGEDALIARHFAGCGAARADVLLGIGDDAALLQVPPDRVLVAAVDTLIGGVHVDEAVAPRDLGHKALAVNLSDLAAMGADPAWALLALTVPQAEAAWLDELAAGLHELAARWGVAVVGGDTTRGPLAVTVTALGTVPAAAALTRSGARPGDAVYVTGTLGDAGLALEVRAGRRRLDGEAQVQVMARLERPEPRLEAGRRLRGVASSAIDVSDGLAADLGRILAASGVGAEIELDRLPLSPALRAACPRAAALELALGAGDDYELCFTVPAALEPGLQARLAGAAPIARIGTVTAERGLVLRGAGAEALAACSRGYRHFD